ncbi:hypothetical protein BCR35DRAFT_304498 [Leucosporidium creatinivorum]|uniref:RING-CH-type domain-containing protein n=1 Tax=Leucosporidium creatinivorum TaxID=106004 RepID=A0A1Y2F9J0_9BASI|nr:hypothetical protein BCR35DRAFT_304498 [Leucosporidium creatinivorum]
MEEDSHLSPSIPAPVVESTSAPPSPDKAAWQDQLALARESLKQRVEQQQAEDGSVEIPHIPSPPPAVEHAAADELPGQSGDAAHSTSDRRGSTTSNGTAEEEQDEDEDDFVHHHLTGLRRRRPAEGGSGSAAGATETPRAAPRAAPDAAEEQEKVCRICFGGPEEEEELGKLFSPCVCRGTSRYVHVQCLEHWRQASANSASFYACDQCGFQYRFSRTRFAKLFSSRLTLLGLTVLLFTFLIWLSGFLANTLISVAEKRKASLQGGMFEDIFVSDHIILSEGVRDAVTFFDTRLTELAAPTASAIANGDDDLDDSDGIFSQLSAIVQDPLILFDLAGYEEKQRQKRRAQGKRKAKRRAILPRWLLGTLLHFSKGLSLIGIVSVFHGYLATSFLSPIARGLLRAARPQARRNGRDAIANNASQALAVVFVVIGVLRAIRQVYRAVRWLSRLALRRVESLVLEV